VVSDGSSVLFTDEDQSTDDDSCTTYEGSEDSREPPGEHNTRMRVIQEAYDKTERRSGASFLVLSCQGAELQSLREEDVHIQRPSSRSPLLELILDKWLRSNPKPFKIAPLAEFLRQIRMLPAEYAISVYYALVKRVKPVCRSLYRIIHRSIFQYLPDHENILDTANAKPKNLPPRPLRHTRQHRRQLRQLTARASQLRAHRPSETLLISRMPQAASTASTGLMRETTRIGRTKPSSSA
jgi:hypothetical protein